MDFYCINTQKNIYAPDVKKVDVLNWEISKLKRFISILEGAPFSSISFCPAQNSEDLVDKKVNEFFGD
jgi:hypothetical protein